MLGREGHGSHDSALETLSGGSDGAMRGARVPREISRLFEGVGISLLTWTSEFFFQLASDLLWRPADDVRSSVSQRASRHVGSGPREVGCAPMSESDM